MIMAERWCSLSLFLQPLTYKVHSAAADLINRKECKKIKIRRKSKAKADAAELHHFTSSPVFSINTIQPFRKPYPSSRDYSCRVTSTASPGRGPASISADSSRAVVLECFFSVSTENLGTELQSLFLILHRYFIHSLNASCGICKSLNFFSQKSRNNL